MFFISYASQVTLILRHLWKTKFQGKLKTPVFTNIFACGYSLGKLSGYPATHSVVCVVKERVIVRLRRNRRVALILVYSYDP